jgi:endonuclease YncB( thermonuclease family)
MFYRIFALLLICSLYSCDQAVLKQVLLHALGHTISADTNNGVGYKVVGIKDGDTVVLLMDGKEQTIRLGHVDCPESKQPFGRRAKQFTSDMCFGEYVTLQVDEKNKYDRNKRLIAEIILANGRNVNKELVKNGLAWHFVQYSKDEEYAALEVEARKSRYGVWSQPDPIAPWDWRKMPKKK